MSVRQVAVSYWRRQCLQVVVMQFVSISVVAPSRHVFKRKSLIVRTRSISPESLGNGISLLSVHLPR